MGSAADISAATTPFVGVCDRRATASLCLPPRTPPVRWNDRISGYSAWPSRHLRRCGSPECSSSVNRHGLMRHYDIRRLGVEVVIVTGAGAATEGPQCRHFRLDLSARTHARGSEARRLRHAPKGCCRKTSSGLSSLPACQACRWGCVGMVPAPTQRQSQIAVPVATATAATWRALSITIADP